MSNVKELADAEAARAEAENPDEPDTPEEPDTPDEGEPDTEATPVEPPAQPEAVDSDAQVRAIESELRRHEKAWAKIVNVDPDALHVCAACGGVGFTEEDQPEVLTATFAEACPECNGYGKVFSGALNEQTRLIDCRRCTGYGYVNKIDAPMLPANGPVETEPVTPKVADPEVDRLRGLGYTIIEPMHVNVG